MDAEIRLIGLLIEDPTRWQLAEITADDFTVPNAVHILAAVADLADSGGGIFAVAERLRERGTPIPITELGQLEAGHADNLLQYVGLVRKHARLRRLSAACRATIDASKHGDPDELVASLGVSLDGLMVARKETSDFANTVALAWSQAQESSTREDHGIPTGIPCIDQRTGGFQPGRVFVIAARPSIGKSALLNQAGIHAARKGYPGLIVSLEMTKAEIGMRALAHASQVNVTKLSRGDLGSLNAAEAEKGWLSAIPLFVEDDTYSLAGIVAAITQAKRKHGIVWAAVDHIGLVETEKYSNRNEQLGGVTRALKKIAKQLDIAIVALSQMNRSVEKDRRRPVLADLRDSGNVEQDADICLFLHSEAEDGEREPIIQLGLLKNRAGIRGWIPNEIRFYGATQTFREMSSVTALREPPSHWTDAA